MANVYLSRSHDWRDRLPPGFRDIYFTYIMTSIDSVELSLSQRQRNVDIAKTIEREFYERALNKSEYKIGIFEIIERLTRPTSQRMQLLVRQLGLNPAPTNRMLVNMASSVGQGSSSAIQYFPPQMSEQARNQTHSYVQSRARPSTPTNHTPVNTDSSAGQGSSSDIQYFPPQMSEQARNQRHNYFQSRAGPSIPTNHRLVNTASSAGQVSSYFRPRGSEEAHSQIYNYFLSRPSTPTNHTLVNTASSVGQVSSSDLLCFRPRDSEEAHNQIDNYFLSRPSTSTAFSFSPPRQEPAPLIAQNIAQIASRLASSQVYTATLASHHQNYQELLIRESEQRVGGPRDETSERIYRMRLRFVHFLCTIYRKYVEASQQGLAEAELLELIRIKTILNGVIISLLKYTEIPPLSRETLDNYERDIYEIVHEL